MKLVFRPKRIEDFDRYFDMDYVGRIGYDPGPAYKDRIRVEYRVFNKGEPCWMVAHDEDRSEKQEIAFVAACYIADWVVEALIQSPDPYPQPKFLAWIREGRYPFIKGKDIGKANAKDGLNLMVTHFGWDKTLSEEEAALVRGTVLVRFSSYYAGARYKRMLAEVYSEASLNEVQNAGYTLLNDYPGWLDSECRSEFKPRLMILERSAAIQGNNFSMKHLFAYQEPRLFFSKLQRDVLLLARHRFTDQEIAKELGIGEEAIKARWRTIYSRVENRLPGLLPEGLGSRGLEKRRRLLAHLENHPSEFWPFTP